MSHELRELDRAGYSLKPAWHGLGKTFDRIMTTKEVLEETSIGAYDVVQGGGFVAVDPETKQFWEGPDLPPENFIWVPTQAMFNFRNDLDPTDSRALLSPLGVSRGYEVVQNSELCAIADTIIGESGARYESAGTLRNGKLVWLLARMPGEMDVSGDKVSRYILIHQSHDSSAPITVAATPIRVVCWNTLSAALNSENDNRIVLYHKSNVRDRIADAIKAVQKSRELFERDQRTFHSMSQKALENRFVDAFLKSLYPNPKSGKRTAIAEGKRSRIARLAYGEQAGGDSEAMIRDGQPTAYGLYNAVAQYWQYESNARPRKDRNPLEERMRSNMLAGTQERERSKALAMLARADELEDTLDQLVTSN